MKYDLSICLPAIRTQNWKLMYDTACASVGDKTFEIVFVSPYDLPKELQSVSNVKLVKDWGCPTRCVQLGTTHCEGELITHATDDGIFVAGALDKAVDLYRQQCKEIDGVILRYTEGPGRPTTTKAHANNKYWKAKYHPSLLLGGVNKNHRWGVYLLNLGFYREIGGLDCEYEHMNFSLHDICYRGSRPLTCLGVYVTVHVRMQEPCE